MNIGEYSAISSSESDFFLSFIGYLENFLNSYDFSYWFRKPFFPHFTYSAERKLDEKNIDDTLKE